MMNLNLIFRMRARAKVALVWLGLSVLPLGEAQAQTVPFAPGDLLMGFHVTGGFGSDVTYVVNLGSAALLYRDSTQTFTIASIGLLGPDLVTAFGPDWFSRNDLYWGVFGVNTNAPSGTAVNGDPVRTIYASQDRPNISEQSTAPTIVSSTVRGTVSTNMQSAQNAFATKTGTVASNGRGAIVSTTTNNDYAEFNPKSPDSSFGSFSAGGGIEGNFGAGAAGTVLDLYRILNSTSGAEPTGAVGQGSYEGSFTITPGGEVTFAVVPEPGAVALLLAGFSCLGLARWRRREASCR